MWDYQAMQWNLNPRTLQSMSMIQTPYGQLPANVFLAVPKELFFANSDFYCCQGRAAVNYNCCQSRIRADYAQALANIRMGGKC